MSIIIKDWDSFQHFKDRRPPWIKLYRDLLEDAEWFGLSGEAAKFLIMIWLLASEDKSKAGKIPSVSKIAFRLRTSEKAVNKLLTEVDHWLIRDDDGLSSGCHQDDAPETETETETKREEETKTEGKKFSIPSPSDVEQYSNSIGYPMDGQAWCDSYAQKGWMVGKSKMKDWKAAVRNWKSQKWKPSANKIFIESTPITDKNYCHIHKVWNCDECEGLPI
jgi:hypothetical protein